MTHEVELIMPEPSSSSAALVERWRERASTGIAGATVTEPILPREYTLDAEPGSYTISPGTAQLGLKGEVPQIAIALPEVLFGVSLIVPDDTTPEGVLIQAVAPAWRRFARQLASDSNAFLLLDWRQTEELVAGAYYEEGWTVTLTPRSGDLGRDVIAHRDDFGSIRVLDQVKAYGPNHVVTANDVRAMAGVLSNDAKASKAVVTTTSRFAAGVAEEFANRTPSRIELRDGQAFRAWITRIFEKD